MSGKNLKQVFAESCLLSLIEVGCLPGIPFK